MYLPLLLTPLPSWLELVQISIITKILYEHIQIDHHMYEGLISNLTLRENIQSSMARKDFRTLSNSSGLH